MKRSFHTVTDFWCGAGGSSKGAEDAGAEVLFAANHWKTAADTFKTNHPKTDVDIADVSKTNPRRYDRTDILIASPECTNHTPAKGVSYKHLDQGDLFGCASCEKHGESNCPVHSDAIRRSRAGGWDIIKFVEHHRYEIVVIENVVQWVEWGDFQRWWRAMENLGYIGQKVFFNSMFAPPTPQSRDRVYIVWHRRGNRAPDVNLRPLAYCGGCDRHIDAAQTFKPGGSPKKKYRSQYVYTCATCTIEVHPYYYAALNAIDFSLPIVKIGEREQHGLQPLKPRTLARIQYGIDKEGSKPLVVTVNQTNRLGGRVRGASSPLFTQPGCAVTALSLPFVVETAFSQDGNARAKSTMSPLPTQSGRQSLGFVTALRGTSEKQLEYSASSFTDPLGTISAGGVHAGIAAVDGAAIVDLRDWKVANQLVSSLGHPLPAQVATAQTALVSRMPFVMSYYSSGGGQARGVADPLGAISTTDRHAIVIPDINEWYFRMFKPPEIGIGMAFPSTYVVHGNDRDQVKQYGNAVTPPVMKWLIHRCIESLNPKSPIYDPWAAYRWAA